MNRTQSEIVAPIEKSAHAPGNFNCRQAGIMLDVHHSYYVLTPIDMGLVCLSIRIEAMHLPGQI